MKASIASCLIALSLIIDIVSPSGVHCQTLHRQFTGIGATLNAISFASDTTAAAVGDSAVAVTTNDLGTTWSLKPVASTDVLYCAYFWDETSGAFGGDNGKLFVVHGQGVNPVKVQLPETQTIYAITYPSADTAVLVGGGGMIYKTNDSGKTWSKIQPPAALAGRDLYGIEYWDDSTYWIVGHGGMVFYTEDAGTKWQRINVNTNHDIYSISFQSSTGWMVGDGILLYTQDTGTTWLDAGGTAQLRQVASQDELTAYAVGLSGTLLATHDAKTWAPIETGTTANFYGVAAPDSIFICGDSGIVMTTLAVAAPTASFTASNDTFARIKVGTSEVNSKLVITNTSNSVPVTILTATIDSSEFTLETTANNAFPFTIPPGQKHALDIRFTPQYPGLITSYIHISPNEAGSFTAMLFGAADPAAGVTAQESANIIHVAVSNFGGHSWIDIPATLTLPLHIEVLNVLGERLLSSPIPDNLHVDVSALLPGVYFYRVTADNGSSSGKFVLR